MNSSARNKYQGTVTSVTRGPVSAEIEVKLSGGIPLCAVVTHESVDALGLEVGKEVFAFVKAPSVMIVSGGDDIKFSARNQLKGKVTALVPGGVNTDVTIGLDGGHSVSAVVTNDSAKRMNLKVGDPASAVFKAYSVVLGVKQ